MKHTRSQTLLSTCLEALHVPHTEAFVRRVEEETPWRHTLYGLIRMLAPFGVRTEAVRVARKERLAELPAPFVAQAGGDLVVVTAVGGGEVAFVQSGALHRLPAGRFVEQWSGVVLTLEADAASAEPGYARHRRDERFHRAECAVLAACVAALLVGGFLHTRSAAGAAWGLRGLAALVGMVGAGLSFLLVLEGNDGRSDLADRLCRTFGGGGCGVVQQTAGARFMGRYGWGAVGLAYFAVGAVVTLGLPAWFPSVAAVGVLALPYTLWSVWYQRFRARRWCALCLWVQVVVWVQLAVFACAGVYRHFALDVARLVLLLVAYGAAFLAVHLSLPLFARSREASRWRADYYGLKRRADVFFALLGAQPAVDVAGASTLWFGSADAPHTVTVFSNPYCRPCARLHPHLEALVCRGWRVGLVMTAFNAERRAANRALIAAYRLDGPERTWERLAAWYTGPQVMDMALFADLHPDEATARAVEAEMARHDAWADAHGLTATPHLWVDGHELPAGYRAEDVAALA